MRGAELVALRAQVERLTQLQSWIITLGGTKDDVQRKALAEKAASLAKQIHDDIKLVVRDDLGRDDYIKMVGAVMRRSFPPLPQTPPASPQ